MADYLLIFRSQIAFCTIASKHGVHLSYTPMLHSHFLLRLRIMVLICSQGTKGSLLGP